MLIDIPLPRLHELMTTGVVTRVHVAPGSTLAVGAPLVDVRVDLSNAAAHDCPPVSYFRVVLRDTGVLRTLAAQVGSDLAPGQRLGLLTTTADEPLEGNPARAARLTTVGVLGLDEEW